MALQSPVTSPASSDEYQQPSDVALEKSAVSAKVARRWSHSLLSTLLLNDLHFVITPESAFLRYGNTKVEVEALFHCDYDVGRVNNALLLK